jgi:hypothetical protein
MDDGRSRDGRLAAEAERTEIGNGKKIKCQKPKSPKAYCNAKTSEKRECDFQGTMIFWPILWLSENVTLGGLFSLLDKATNFCLL